ncbi:hypothetical protein CPAR01_11805 [Colletotrichum paranaense]|uniref:Uncharacterized protein n=1 Tax=Colletotrichum paranaense TaxID=1914294 RepID=A0ABQ9S9J6_9PEZI|nr:uncharacterized protein CPAR01_11805 [Colletotrichum paranaense]KAK1529493.1 hypothetical protein CPAR01_11805 [Colletotrichum paranaense]
MPNNYVPLSREQFWDGNREMIGLTAEYQTRVEKAVAEGFLKNGRSHPWNPTTPRPNMPKFYIMNFGSHPVQCGVNHGELSIRDLFEHFEKAHDINKPFRRLIILEDLDPRMAEMLGVKLNIPPEFWLAHCDETCRLNPVDGIRNRQGRSRYWRVSVPQVRAAPTMVEQEEPEYVIEAGAFNRFNVVLPKNGALGSIVFYSLVSFWGMPDEKDGWTIVILVDPRQTTLRKLKEGRKTDRISLSDIRYIRLHFTKEVIVGANDAPLVAPHACVIYDHLRLAYDKNLDIISGLGDPFVATVPVRNLIFSLWEEFACRHQSDLYDELLYDEAQWRDFSSAAAVKRLESDFDTDGEAYQHIVSEGRTIRKHRRIMKDIRDCFLAPDVDQWGADSGITALTFGSVMDSTQGQGPVKHWQGIDHTQRQVAMEQRRWNKLDDMMQEVERTFETFMDNFAKRADMQRFFVNNRQARSAGQLTKLATVAVPFSIVSAIFSMGGDFAAGERLFWVYWGVALPVTGLLLIWIIFSVEITEYRKRVENDLKKAWPKRTKGNHHCKNCTCNKGTDEKV